mmetsp:Transcript_12850/g.21374  ORF Transcript_12850/g.21374 Transcript_12850/m.21374 type:complete len:257 (+) Transcript_12850:4444-5214(+)
MTSGSETGTRPSSTLRTLWNSSGKSHPGTSLGMTRDRWCALGIQQSCWHSIRTGTLRETIARTRHCSLSDSSWHRPYRRSCGQRYTFHHHGVLGEMQGRWLMLGTEWLPQRSSRPYNGPWSEGRNWPLCTDPSSSHTCCSRRERSLGCTLPMKGSYPHSRRTSRRGTGTGRRSTYTDSDNWRRLPGSCRRCTPRCQRWGTSSSMGSQMRSARTFRHSRRTGQPGSRFPSTRRPGRQTCWQRTRRHRHRLEAQGGTR